MHQAILGCKHLESDTQRVYYLCWDLFDIQNRQRQTENNIGHCLDVQSLNEAPLACSDSTAVFAKTAAHGQNIF